MIDVSEFKEAIRSGDLDTIKQAIKENFDINANLDKSYIPSFISERVSIARVARAVWPENRDNLGYRPLHWAARVNNVEILQYLLEKEADINATNYIGNTPLHIALYHQSEDCIPLLLEKEADITIANTGSSVLGITERFTALHYAVLYGSDDVLEALLKLIPDGNVSGTNGLTALHLAVNMNSVGKVRLLLASGANPNQADDEGLTTLHHAVLQDKVGDLEIFKELYSAGADPNQVDHQGNTPLHTLIEKNSISADLDAAKALSMGHYDIDLFKANQQGKTARELALSRDNHNLLSILNTMLAKHIKQNYFFGVNERKKGEIDETVEKSTISNINDNSHQQPSSPLPPAPPPPPPIYQQKPIVIPVRTPTPNRPPPPSPLDTVDRLISEIVRHPRFQATKNANRPAKEENNNNNSTKDDKWNDDNSSIHTLSR